MSNKVIRAELETRLKTWADAQTPIIPVAFQGVSFTKPTSGVWLEPFLLPNNTLNKELSGTRKTYIGLFHINCWAPSGTGMGQVEQLSQQIVDLYPHMLKIGAVSIESTPSAEKPIPDNGWVIVPVTVQYRMESL